MKKLLLLLMLFSTPVMAVEPITGAFGVKLGDVWDGEAIATFEKDGYFIHGFIPDLPHDLFDTYAVNVTPVKKLIFAIGGAKKGGCEQYQALKKALIKKYGAGEERDEFGHVWGHGQRKLQTSFWPYARTIYIRCKVKEDEGIKGLYINYQDWDIYDSRTDKLPDTSNL